MGRAGEREQTATARSACLSDVVTVSDLVDRCPDDLSSRNGSASEASASRALCLCRTDGTPAADRKNPPLLRISLLVLQRNRSRSCPACRCARTVTGIELNSSPSARPQNASGLCTTCRPRLKLLAGRYLPCSGRRRPDSRPAPRPRLYPADSLGRADRESIAVDENVSTL